MNGEADKRIKWEESREGNSGNRSNGRLMNRQTEKLAESITQTCMGIRRQNHNPFTILLNTHVDDSTRYDDVA